MISLKTSESQHHINRKMISFAYFLSSYEMGRLSKVM